MKAEAEEAEWISAPGVLKVEPGLVSQVEEEQVPGQKAERVTQVETVPAAVHSMASSFRDKG